MMQWDTDMTISWKLKIWHPTIAFQIITRKHSNRMQTAPLPTTHTSVATGYQQAVVGGPQEKFEQVTSLGYQMSLAGVPVQWGPMSGGHRSVGPSTLKSYLKRSGSRAKRFVQWGFMSGGSRAVAREVPVQWGPMYHGWWSHGIPLCGQNDWQTDTTKNITFQ